MADGPSLGARLRALRRERGWTLKQLAGRTGLSVSYLSDLERGRSRPSLETLARLAEALGVPRAALLGEEPPAAGQPLTPQAPPPQARPRAPASRSPEPGWAAAEPPPVGRLAAAGPLESTPAMPAAEPVLVAASLTERWPHLPVEDPSLPEVQALLADPQFGPEIGPRWARLLAVLAAEVRQAAGRPLSRRQLLEAYLFLRRVVGDLDRPRRRR